MSNFMPLRQLIADLINTLLLAILKPTGGRVSACVCVCVFGARSAERTPSVCVCLRDRGASEKGCQHVHPSQQRRSFIDTECVFQAIKQELRLKTTCLEVCCCAASKEAIVVVYLVEKVIVRASLTL